MGSAFFILQLPYMRGPVRIVTQEKRKDEGERKIKESRGD